MRMRTKLLVCLLSVSCGLAALSLIAVHRVVERQARSQISSDLNRSLLTYHQMQGHRLQMLSREASLLAEIPHLKALLTTEDRGTIVDEGIEFYRVAGTEMFAIADAHGRPVVCYLGSATLTGDAAAPCFPASGIASPEYSIVGDHLYLAAAQPVYFGSPVTGSILGYLAVAYEINHGLAAEIAQAAAAEVVFSANGKVLATTLDDRRRQAYATPSKGSSRDGAEDVWVGSQHYLRSVLDLSSGSSPSIQLAILKSFDEASRNLGEINQLLAGIGILVLILGSVLALYISSTITRPLEQLVAGTRALGSGDFRYAIQDRGSGEIRELSTAFNQMRVRLLNAQQELLQSERLATIGRMARSISHDLRHYLAAVYANAEFLGYESTRPDQRAGLLEEVRMGVQGMTDLLDSLLIFSRTGNSLQLAAECMQQVAERALAMMRMHPDAQGVDISAEISGNLIVWIDARKIERAIYNLLLNACQACRTGEFPSVTLSLTEDEDWIRLSVTDNGPGVAEKVRVTLFEPFVSEGKQSGVGIGLALVNHITKEHGGSVALDESRPGRTVFSLSLCKERLAQFKDMAHAPQAAAQYTGT